jgi:putative spermidine/putrescine transport system permease protein
LVKSGLLAGAILGFAAAFNDYAVSVFLVDPTIQTLPVQLMGLMQTGVDPTIAAAATFTVIIMIVLLFACEKIVGIDKLMTVVKY